jgi:hypothetical protein
MPRSAFLNPRHHSLARANTLVWSAVFLAIFFSGFPRTHPTPLQLIPTALALAGTAETFRCIRKRWSLYHAGVLLCLYMDLMAIFTILFFLIYPYAQFFTSAH